MSQVPTIQPIRKIPAEISNLLGDAPLWRGECREQFDAIVLSIGLSVGAKDLLDWASARDVAHHLFELRRLRSLQAALIQNAQVAIIEGLLKTTYDKSGPAEDVTYYLSGARNDARRWAADPKFAESIDEQLAARGYDRASILAKAYLSCESEMQELDKAICDLELRRMTTLREIDRRDEVLSRRLQIASQRIIEGEFSEAAE